MTTKKILPIGGKFSPELVNRAVELTAAGLGFAAVAEQTGISQNALARWMRMYPDVRERITAARHAATKAGLKSAKGRGGVRSSVREAAILEALERGCTREHAAAAAGVAPSRLLAWMDEPQFELAVLAAESKLQEQMLAIIRSHATGETTAKAGGAWTAAAWVLERRFQHAYAIKREVPYAERMRAAAKTGASLADLVVRGLSESGLTAEQQDAVRAKFMEAVEKAV